jgi:hypothetical protein
MEKAKLAISQIGRSSLKFYYACTGGCYNLHAWPRAIRLSPLGSIFGEILV